MSRSPRRGVSIACVSADARCRNRTRKLEGRIRRDAVASGETTRWALTLRLAVGGSSGFGRALGGLPIRAVVRHGRFGRRAGTREWDKKSGVRASAREGEEPRCLGSAGLDMATGRGGKRERFQLSRAAYVGEEVVVGGSDMGGGGLIGRLGGVKDEESSKCGRALSSCAHCCASPVETLGEEKKR